MRLPLVTFSNIYSASSLCFILQAVENELRNHSTIIENLIKDGGSVVSDPNSNEMKTKACEQLKNALRSLRDASSVRKKTLRQELDAFQVGTEIHRVRSVSNGTERVRFKGPQLWQTLPRTIRN